MTLAEKQSGADVQYVTLTGVLTQLWLNVSQKKPFDSGMTLVIFVVGALKTHSYHVVTPGAARAEFIIC